jgi:hypothetical protein
MVAPWIRLGMACAIVFLGCTYGILTLQEPLHHALRLELLVLAFVAFNGFFLACFVTFRNIENFQTAFPWPPFYRPVPGGPKANNPPPARAPGLESSGS